VTEQKSSAPRILIAAVVVLAAGAAGFLFYRAQDSGDAPGLTPAPAVAQSEVPPPPPPAAAPAEKKIPEVLPDITLADIQGKPTKLASFAGRPLMVNFWATWCAPCRHEIPLLNRLREERKPQNIEIVGIAVDFKEDVLKFTQKIPLKYPLLIGEEDGLAAAEAFGMGMAFPFSIFSDSQNRIVAVKIGELHEDEANFAFDRVLDIDKGTLTIGEARIRIAEAFQRFATERAKSEAPAAGKTAS
jgi:thiol-disulfide isomerase/thioredoxin